MQARDLDTHLHAEKSVEVRQRLVEQKYLRFPHHGPADGDALALTAGQILGFAIKHLIELKNFRHRVDATLDFGLVDLRQLQTERHVFRDIHMRVERIGLEHHAH